ncbi:MAG: hypothetical protein NTV05_02675 [Acidobacteria bacterium]|nr:hypothetical protein [Acidobacteriota bacterium]
MTNDPGRDGGRRVDEDAALSGLAARFALGDLSPKRYARQRQQALAELGRRKIAPTLMPGETIIAEHHWVEGHARLPESPFAETGQIAGSLYATERRLFRWRFHDGASPSGRARSDVQETLESQWYAEIAGVERRVSFRWGEALTGMAISVVAWLLSARLGVTGPLLLAVGVFGIVHAMLVPTRYVVVLIDGAGAGWPVWAARTGSGRTVLGEVSKRLAGSVPATEEALSGGSSQGGDHARRQP